MRRAGARPRRWLRGIVEADPGAGARSLSAGARGFSLSLLPYDISARFRALTEQQPSAWIFTSATLALDGHFEHFARRLGLEEAATLLVDSPFDYQRQALLYLPAGLPEPGTPQFTAAALEAVLPLVEAAGWRRVPAVHQPSRAGRRRLRRAAGRLAAAGAGRRRRASRLARFRESGRAVLLGTASFWEGVDVQGSALRLVVIDKLPFAAPDDRSCARACST
ncbi:MAG: helicase C-terminal domain-containing protein [Steroidobacteraceae bacterium]